MAFLQVVFSVLVGLALCNQAGESIDDANGPKEKLFIDVVHAHTIKPGSSLISSLGGLKSRCAKDVSHVLATFEPSATVTFELLTNLRYMKDFDVFEYDSFTLDTYTCRFKGASSSSFSFEIMPGKVTDIAMANNKISPYVDVITHVKHHPTGIPYEDLIAEKNTHARIEATKFVYGGFFLDSSPFETKIKAPLTPGLVYRAKLATVNDAGKMFDSFIGVEYAGNYDGPRYPELESGSYFRLDTPFWPAPQLIADDPNGTAYIRIIHDPRFECNLVIENWWGPTVALIFRRNIDVVVWLFIVFLISSSGWVGLAVGVSGFVRLTLDGDSALIENALTVIIAYCLAISIHSIFSALFSLTRKLEAFRKAYPMSIKIGPLVILLPCLFLQLWSLIPVFLAMQLLILQSLFSLESKAENKATSFLLQVIALTMYVSVRIPDIMAAVQYHIPMPFEVEKEVVWLWALILWSRLYPSGRKSSSLKHLARTAFMACLILAFLPHLQLYHVWPGFCLHLTINLLSSFI